MKHLLKVENAYIEENISCNSLLQQLKLSPYNESLVNTWLRMPPHNWYCRAPVVFQAVFEAVAPKLGPQDGTEVGRLVHGFCVEWHLCPKQLPGTQQDLLCFHFYYLQPHVLPLKISLHIHFSL